ncbi:MAG: WbqC family protein [Raineya sp.]|nr:WbqC family protein [Raineya sp.]
MNILIEPHYLPSIAYFCVLWRAEKIVFEIFEYYEKQSYRNRCYINTSQGRMLLSVPIKHAGKQIFKDVRIDYSENWVDVHWRSIASAYGKAPFFEYFAESFQKILYQKPVFLLDLNINLLTNCLKILGWQKVWFYSEKYVNFSPDYVDLRSAIHPKKTERIQDFYKSVSYIQVFGNKFEENLSVIDLIFCEGTQSEAIIKNSLPNK